MFTGPFFPVTVYKHSIVATVQSYGIVSDMQ